MKTKREPHTKAMPYGIRAYGSEHRFSHKEDYLEYLLDWIDNTDGAEQDRAFRALNNLRSGISFTDTDADLR